MKDIFILGSTGSIGLSTLNVIKRDKKKFKIRLLTTNNNAKKILRQAIEFNVKKIVILNKLENLKFEKLFKKNKITVFFNIKDALIRNKKKSFLTINAISGIGLGAILQIIKFTKNLAIANKSQLFVDGHLLVKN